jgi:AGCS family alanine or glycine:cation symporter
METVEKLLETWGNAIWGPPMIVLLLGTHLFLTVRLRFVQRYIVKAIRLSLGRSREGAGDISQFGALTTALASTIGTGNIIGVGTAIAAGGPGAVFWIWITGVFGIATKYAEAVLSIKYRVVNKEGFMAGGPMYVLERGMKQRWLGVVFAFLMCITAFGIGNMVQSNAIATMAKETFAVPTWITGLVIMTLSAVVILGGIRSIAAWCERLVPLMALIYVGGCATILVMNIHGLPHTLRLILDGAFSGQAAVGGFIGAGVRETIRYGIARGLFSNESGLGSAPIVAAAAQTKNPVRQALVSSTGTFWDTVVVCAMTGLVLVNSGEWIDGAHGAVLSKEAFSQIPVVGPIVLTFGLLTFVFSTILGWSYYGEKAVEYLFGTRYVRYYRWLWVVCVMLGSVATVRLVWSFADITNALMAIPNLLSLIVLSGVIAAETKKYLWEGSIEAPSE